MRELTTQEIKQTNGGFLNFLVGSLIGFGMYALNKHNRHEPITLAGSTTAIGFGAVTGGVGGVAARAAGGGVVGNVVWRPGAMAVNGAGQLIAKEK